MQSFWGMLPFAGVKGELPPTAANKLLDRQQTTGLFCLPEAYSKSAFPKYLKNVVDFLLRFKIEIIIYFVYLVNLLYPPLPPTSRSQPSQFLHFGVAFLLSLGDLCFCSKKES